jgi:biopolymer transport protein ExbD
MAKGKMKKADIGGDDEPDLTPMIDVIFLLIIFFLIAGKMIQAGRPKIDVPIAAEAIKADKDARRIEFTVDSQGNLYFLESHIGDVSNPQPLTEKIEERRTLLGADASKLQVYLRVDSEATYGDVKRVMGACAKAKQQKILFAAYTTES